MTAEVAILNQYGVAMAADSAVTIGGKRVWQSSNKLFSIHPEIEIGVMVYGGADYSGIPWETVIKDWRSKLGTTRFSTVGDCAEHLVRHLKSVRSTQSWESFSAGNLCLSWVERLAGILNPLAKTRKELNDIISPTTEHYFSEGEALEEIDDFWTEEEFIALYGDMISEFCDSAFKFPIYKKNKLGVKRLCFQSARRRNLSESFSGIVLAGFGKDEILPSLYQYFADGRFGEKCRIWGGQQTTVDIDQNSAIVSYAQHDIVTSLLEGVDERNTSFLNASISRLLSEKTDSLIDNIISDKDERVVEREIQKRLNKEIVSEFMRGYREMRHTNIVVPVLDVVASLPKEEIAIMAEALVEITSLMRKVGSTLQTVGGPVDVAVISKGDGFIWMKRKKYFDPADNPGYLERRYQSRLNGGGGA